MSSGAYHVLDVIPLRVGVPKSRTSNYEKFEAPDPAEWTAKGYAIANVDMRGCFDSEGIIGSVKLSTLPFLEKLVQHP